MSHPVYIGFYFKASDRSGGSGQRALLSPRFIICPQIRASGIMQFEPDKVPSCRVSAAQHNILPAWTQWEEPGKRQTLGGSPWLKVLARPCAASVVAIKEVTGTLQTGLVSTAQRCAAHGTPATH